MLSAQQQVTINRIAQRHSVLLGGNDPILMVQTMLESAQEDAEHQQKKRLKEFAENVESAIYKWQEAVQAHSNAVLNNAYKHSEDIINKSLAAAQQNVTAALQKTTDETIGRMTREAADVLTALETARQLQQRSATACTAGAIGIIALLALEALRAGGFL